MKRSGAFVFAALAAFVLLVSVIGCADGGTLTTVVAGDRVSGNYTEVYGSGAGEVTFKLAFEAGWPASAASRQ
jgi:hypothetical protein